MVLLIENQFTAKLQWIQEATQDHLFSQEIPPYLFSLWLTELAQSHESLQLEQYYVGGVFNFIFQTGQSEHTQKPALYVLCDLDVAEHKLYYWQYRVCYVHPWLIIDTLIPPNQRVDHPDGFQERIALLNEM